MAGKTIHKPAAPGTHQASQAESQVPAVGRNWHYYDGILYDTVIEPLAREMRDETVACVSVGSRVIDVCCGTGGLVLHLAKRCDSVVGIDHAIEMIDYARRRQQQYGLKNVTFTHADARCLSQYQDQEFDCAVVSLALHEMPRALGVQVLKEAARIAKEIIIVDYATPMPSHTEGLVYRYMEVVAGLSHFKGFLDYSRHRGLDALVEDAALVVKSDATTVRGCIRIVKTARRDDRTGVA